MSNLKNQNEIAHELGRSEVKTARCFAGKIQVVLENGYTFYARKTNGDKYIGGNLMVIPYPWGIRYDGTLEDSAPRNWFALRARTRSTTYKGTKSMTLITDGYRATHEEAAAELTATPTVDSVVDHHFGGAQLKTDYERMQAAQTSNAGRILGSVTPAPAGVSMKTTTLKLTPYQVDVLRFALYTQEQLFGEKIDNGSSQPGDMAERNCLSLLQGKLPEQVS